MTKVADGFQISASGATSNATIVVGPPSGQTLTTGVYVADRFPHPTTGLFLLNGSSCLYFTPARFVVTELALDADGNATRLALRFEVNCSSGLTTFGAIAYQALEPPLTHTIAPRAVVFTGVTQHAPSPTKAVTIGNPGAGPLPIDTVSVTQPFSIVSDTCSNATLAPTESCTVGITVDTSEFGTFWGKLAIPDGLAVIDGTGAFEVSMRAEIAEDPFRFAEQSLTIGGDLIPIVGDFDGDAVDHDILWYGPGAATDRIWFADGDRTWTKQNITVGGAYEPIVGYFNGDSVADIIWYAAGTKGDWLWYGKPGGGFTARALTINGTFWPLGGDFDGNNIDDVLWYAPGAAADSLWLGNADGTFTKVTKKINGTYDSVYWCDVDGNGRSDLLWWRADRTTHPVWKATSGGQFSAVTVTAPGPSIPNIGHFDGDAKTDIFWYGPTTYHDVLVLANGQEFSSYNIGGAFATGTGNFSGDNGGRSEIFWWNPGSGSDRYWSSDGSQLEAKTYANTKIPFDGYWPVFGYFDSTSTNGALDIMWYGPGAVADRIFWGRDVDGVPLPIATHASRGDASNRDELRESTWVMQNTRPR
ncbi:MAG TPA: FG-GAP-like repeat-containing protein [Acidimicrobiia bacterium]|nr:FG-GAP-like repeat-containing protein [Acidimicrobiia bacterium]